MSTKCLPEESSSPKKTKLIDILSQDIDTKFKLNLNINSIKKSSKIQDYLSSPKPLKEISVEKDNEYYSPYVKRTISNMIQSTTKNNFTNYKNPFLTTSKKLFSKKLYTPSPNVVKSEKLSDRFIPLNKGINLMEKFNLTAKFDEVNENINPEKTEGDDNANEVDNRNSLIYNELLKSNVLKENNNTLLNKLSINSKIDFQKNSKNQIIKSKLFSWKKESIPKSNFCYELFNNQKENLNNINNNSEYKNQRKINQKPYKELLTSNLIDDFYLNLLDWSSKDQIAVGCTTSVVLWNNNKTQSEILLNYPCGNLEESENFVEKYVSSLIWSNEGDKLAVGHSLGCVEIYDVNKKKMISNYGGHTGRVGVVSWNGNIISSGSKDCNIITRDIRCKNNNENIIVRYLGHSQEVCGLKWSFDGSQLASGGNDNNLMIWNLHSTKPIMCNNSHLAAVKAIAWSPHHHNILASGGGTADRTIRFWNTSTFENILKYDTGSQVCNLVFSKTSNELISTHGFSLNQINIWKLPNLTKTATLIGHTFRVLYLGLSPNGQNIVTGAGDQTLKFWNVFPPFKADNNSNLFPSNRDFR
jgi:cell division cycle 20-like protein 1 (cofactor of APC complex)